MAPMTMVEMATIEGARANGLESRTGSPTPGKDADIVMLRTDLMNVMPLNSAYGAIVTGMDTSNVDTALVAGRIVKSRGRLVGIDLASHRKRVAASRWFEISSFDPSFQVSQPLRGEI